MNTTYASFLSFVLMTLFSAGVWGFEALSDKDLNAITAGNAKVGYESMDALTRIPFHYSSRKGSVDGEVIVVPMAIYNQAASLQLMDNAQSNLSSLININAVNSPIQVLLNLNINVNSTIGSLNQWNSLVAN